MPRPRVHPDLRQRVAEACDICRELKKRCSGTVPCTACQRRGMAATCRVTRRTVKRHRRDYPVATSTEIPARDAALNSSAARRFDGISDPATHDAPSEPEQNRQRLPEDVNIQQAASSPQPVSRIATCDATAQRRTAAGIAATNKTPSTGTHTPRLGAESHARMLLNLRGERVYIGRAASLSFLQFVRDMVSDQIGPSQFSHNDKQDSMLETEAAESTTTAAASAAGSGIEPDLTDEQRASFIKSFQVATGGFLSMFSPDEINTLLLQKESEWSQILPPHMRASINVALAIGAQSMSADDAVQVAQPLIRGAQQTAFSGMLQNVDIDLVRAFVLMAFYMLGECRRNAAYTYLGVAARAAVSLGMHSRDSYAAINDSSTQLRWRIWISLGNLDIIVSSLLGRPPATLALRAEMDEALVDWLGEPFDQSMCCVLASYRIVSIINEAVEELYSKKTVSIALIQQLLSKIEDWNKTLPESFRHASHEQLESGDQRDIITKIHVSSLYYFAVTLVTRPILIVNLTTHSSTRQASSSALSSACLDAATFLVESCSEAQQAGYLLGQMSIMKALVFAAGLILGFDIFAKRELDYEIDDAFRKAREVLDFLGVRSPQAAHYSEILNLLASANAKQKRKIGATRGSKYVERLFSLNSNSGETNNVETQPQDSAFLAVESPGLMEWSTNSDLSSQWTAQRGPVLDDDMLTGWDSLDLSQWDNFPFFNPRTFGLE